MQETRSFLENHLRRQSLWLKEHILWLLDTKVLEESKASTSRLQAIDIGCGPGYVMDIMRTRMNVKGVDIDPDMVAICRSRGLNVIEGSAESIQFNDKEFDVAYCSFLLLWMNDPVKVVREMSRVSRKWVICLAEPDFGARISYPSELAGLDEFLINGIKKDQGDPLIGRKLRGIFRDCGLDADMGIHPGLWDIDRLQGESDDEWKWIEMTAKDELSEDDIDRFKNIWNDALSKKTLFQFSPIFYAFGKK